MKLSSILGVVLLCAALVTTTQSVHAKSTAEIVAQADPSVGRVRVEVSRGVATGTGFVVSNVPGSRDLYFVTNNHVIEGGRTISVGFLHGGLAYKFRATLVTTSKERDLAVLRLQVPTNEAFRPVPIGIAQRKIVKGEDAYAFGFPGTSDELDRKGAGRFESTFSTGTVSRVLVGPFVKNGVEFENVQHTATINPGNSGGPLVDGCANVIGVNTFKHKTADSYLASSSNALVTYLVASNIPYRKVTSACTDDPAPKVTPKPTEPKITTPAITNDKGNADWLVPAAVVVGVIAVFGIIFAFSRSSGGEKGGSSKRPVVAGGRTTLRLTATLPDGSTKTFKITSSMLKAGVTIGKPGSASFGIDAGKISRKHLRLYQDGRKLMVMDLGSTNGSKLDTKPLKANAATQINTSAVLDLGGVKIALSR